MIATLVRLNRFQSETILRRFARTLTACALSFAAARLASLPEGYWALITAVVIVTQPSLSKTVAAAQDQIVGALLGAAVGMVGIVAIVHGTPTLTAFCIGLLPLALIAAWRPSLRLACVTLVIAMLAPQDAGTPYDRPVHRVL